MYSYATYYYFQAVTAKPGDSRMWAALSQCFERLDKHDEAQKAAKWVERVKDKEQFAMNKLASLYRQKGDNDKAAYYFEADLQRRQNKEGY